MPGQGTVVGPPQNRQELQIVNKSHPHLSLSTSLSTWQFGLVKIFEGTRILVLQPRPNSIISGSETPLQQLRPKIAMVFD
jgi:hypothetical protein